jgi:OHCU decarboxylase
MAQGPAKLVGLDGRKGAIAPGCGADLAVFDPDALFVVDPAALHHRHRVTPYEGRTLWGKVVRTYLRGRRLDTEGRSEPSGILVGGGLDRLNTLGEAEARAALFRCCGSARWVERMLAYRPFRSETELYARAAVAGRGLDRADWLEAFVAHPRIGDLGALRAKFASTAAWAAGEQAAVADAAEATLQGLATGNRDYEARFGYLFIVCATGKSADQMLMLLRERLANDPDTELSVASAEQSKITRIRLEKLCR